MAAEAQFKSLIKCRSTIKASITRLINFLTNNDQCDIDDVETRKLKLEEYYQAFEKVQLQIDIYAEDTGLETNQELEREKFEEQYFKCAKIISQRLRSLKPRVTTSEPVAAVLENANAQVTIQQSNSLLPKLEIPPFDGNPLEWHSFHDTFLTLVHTDDKIPAVQKFHLLKNSLRGDLASIIPIRASAENYTVAWDLLKQRCDKPRQIIQSHIKAILELPEIIRDTPSSMRNLKEKALMHVNALRALNQAVDSWDSILIYIIIQKLDKITRRTLERTLENTQMPTFTELIAFLSKQERGDEGEVVISRQHNNYANADAHDSRSRKPNQRVQSFVGVHKRYACVICKANHSIYVCEKFLNLSPRERVSIVKEKQLCINCLRNNHATNKCLSAGCKRCSRKHNTLLHFTDSVSHINRKDSVVTKSEESDNIEQATGGYSVVCNKSSSESTTKTQNNYSVTSNAEVLLGTARIKIFDKNNKEHECRVLLDGGSQCHFISEKLAEYLGLEQNAINLPFAGLGQLITYSKYRVKAKMRSRTTAFTTELEFVALPKITSVLPSRQIHKGLLSIPRNIRLADPEFDKPAEIDALIGTALFYKLLSNGQIQMDEEPGVILQKTLLGWIVVGKIGNTKNKVKLRSCHLITALDDQLSKFWEIEEIPQKRHFTTDELGCEKLYAKTTKRDQDGRYIVRLPFNNKQHDIGESYNMALRRLYSLERKLSKNVSLSNQYHDFLREYRDLGNMSDITDSDDRCKGYYIPHHAVVKENNLTTKVRVVFDGSAKITTNISLNEAMMVGPTVQDELIFNIMRFRVHNVVFAADLKKMYRQIRVVSTDAIFQKILWRENAKDAIRVFRLDTVTQGTASASFLATRTLQQLAKDEGHNFPLAADILRNDFYVDDLLSGAKNVQEALYAKGRLVQLLKLGGFELHKWASNKPELLQNEEGSNAKDLQAICLDSQAKKLLGIHWNSVEDTITYSVKESLVERCATKRTILSQIAQLFDPLGLLGPVIIVAKLVMQELWKANLHWDESIPQSLHTRWVNLKRELQLLNEFKVPRQIICTEPTDIQLHGFCDASENAYGACVYLRSNNKFNNCLVQLVCAKSRVSPVKIMTVPRLELCAALLLSRLIKKVSEALKLIYSKIVMWSDSTIVLHWIRTPPHLLKTFVANRVAEIQSLTNANDWRHISTEENPADFISRGQYPSEFLRNRLWVYGPTWLVQHEREWHVTHLPKIVVTEQRIKTALLTIGRVTSNSQKNDTFEQFSSIHKLERFVALVRRAIANRNSNNKIKGKYTIEEIKNAHTQIIKIVQQNHFGQDIKRLQQGSELNSKSEILCLNPFLDKAGIIRVGGRLRNALISYSRKYPILLPRDDHITTLIIRHEHNKYWHAGVQSTLNSVRQNYWPINGRNVMRQVIHKCVRCSKLNPRLPNYIMGDLPGNRVNQSRPFENVGIDYCGPFYIKEKKFRNKVKVKAYVAVFVCFTTKACHLELVTDLTTDTCLEAIKRFIARRGKPKSIYSDNATNFVGAKNEVLKIRAFLIANENSMKFTHYLQDEGIKWHFIPPRSPHFGGLWEAAVKSFKQHLYRTLGEAMFTYEQFNTCIIEIEAILNSRPLTPLSSDPNDLLVLTPAHFLIGDSLKNVPEYDHREVPVNRLSMWQRIQQVIQHFWQRWHKEYLNELRTRSKWHQGDGSQVKIGTLVTIKEDNVPPMHWSVGRILAVHPGEDGVVRVATVKTQSGTYKRCLKKLSPLPVDI